ncbi:hypothetical protein AAFF_G00060500 [Aldrovandia affinis]|uniref:Uncharacterized protein n=1 Tax=Aldrovandia affinis TaxID=143900 RepID=A0AAD7S0J8_9TELE|nr:hypothetical protein AAFF_G00060500 [Aldrovandia affinis]
MPRFNAADGARALQPLPPTPKPRRRHLCSALRCHLLASLGSNTTVSETRWHFLSPLRSPHNKSPAGLQQHRGPCPRASLLLTSHTVSS